MRLFVHFVLFVVSSPLLLGVLQHALKKRGGRAINKCCEATADGADGVVTFAESSESIPETLIGADHPSAPFRSGFFFFWRSHPSFSSGIRFVEVIVSSMPFEHFEI
ncbi:MAG TPA: hypothetical protein VE422_20620 [Terriglobia bacterium]|nr:hypothetical protein [Terriglobia bacterium]